LRLEASKKSNSIHFDSTLWPARRLTFGRLFRLEWPAWTSCRLAADWLLASATLAARLSKLEAGSWKLDARPQLAGHF